MSAHMKKHLTKVSVGHREFELPVKEAKIILSLIKSIEQTHMQKVFGSTKWPLIYKENFGNFPQWAVCLKAAREKQNLSQRELSHLCNIPATTISKYENGERHISIAQAKKLAKALKIHTKILVGKHN